MVNKRGIEASFAWIFSIIVGAAIIFLAIYAASNLVRTERNVQNSEAGAQLGVLLSPVETSLESARKASIIFPEETRVYNDCQEAGAFGSQGISISVKSGVGEKWQAPGAKSVFYNKYIFSSSVFEGTKANVFVKPFSFPFKVADVIVMWNQDENYCFVNSPTEIEDELGELNFPGVVISNSTDGKDCAAGSIKVCFGLSSGCDVLVDFNSKTVSKNFKKMSYVDSLMYGAIFSDPGIYECQFKRLMKRTSELSYIYFAKSEKLSAEGCSSGMEGDLMLYANMTSSVNSSLQFNSIEFYSKSMEDKNEQLSCKLF